jgi:acylphosphatase
MRMRVSFQGRVQGVGFRATVRDLATRHTLLGWVRNEADGSVTAEVQGRAEVIETFLNELVDSRRSFIRSVDRATLAEEPGWTGFDIVR